MNDTVFDLSVLLQNLKDPGSYAFAGICLGLITVVYVLLTYWMHITEPEDSDE